MERGRWALMEEGAIHSFISVIVYNTLYIIIQPILEMVSLAQLTVRGRPIIEEGELLVKSKKSSSHSQTMIQSVKMEWLLQVMRCFS